MNKDITDMLLCENRKSYYMCLRGKGKGKWHFGTSFGSSFPLLFVVVLSEDDKISDIHTVLVCTVQLTECISSLLTKKPWTPTLLSAELRLHQITKAAGPNPTNWQDLLIRPIRRMLVTATGINFFMQGRRYIQSRWNSQQEKPFRG